MGANELKKSFRRLSGGDWECTVNCELDNPSFGKVSVTAGKIIKRGVPIGGWLDAEWLERYENS